jgi:hypothetical protein
VHVCARHCSSSSCDASLPGPRTQWLRWSQALLAPRVQWRTLHLTLSVDMYVFMCGRTVSIGCTGSSVQYCSGGVFERRAEVHLP